MPQVTKQLPKAPSKSAPKGTGIASHIGGIKLDDIGLHIVIYGQSATGKTSLMSTFPKPLFTMVCGGAGETRSIVGIEGIDTIVDAKGMPSPLNSIDEFDSLMAYIEGEGKDHYKTFALDHATAFQDLALKKVLRIDEAPAQLQWGTATQSQWGEIGIIVKERLRRLLKLRANVVIIAQEREFNTDSSSELLVPYVNTGLSPSVTGWLSTEVDYAVQTYKAQVDEPVVSEVGGKKLTMYKKATRYFARTGPHPVYFSKFRVQRGLKVPDSIVDPTYAKILQIVNGTYKE